MDNANFLAYNDRYTYEVIIARALERGKITESDGRLIRNYVVEKLAKGKIFERRAARIATMLVQWRRFIKVPFEQMTLGDLLEGLRAFQVGKNSYGGEYSQSTKRSMVKTIKTYTRYLIRKKIIEPIDADELKEIEPPEEKYDSIKPKDILTHDDINRLVSACRNSRDRAFIMTLYETGARVGEVARLTWNDLTFLDVDCRVRLEDQKVGGERVVYVVTSIPYLLNYRNDSGNVNGEDFVFKLLERDEPITYRAVTRLMDNLIAATGIEKRVTPKLFRTSRITNMIREGYQESVIKKMMWQKPSTKMLDFYLKLADTDVEKAILKHAGLDKQAVKPEASINLIKCVCGHMNEPTNVYCPRCARSIKEGVKSLREEISEAESEFLKLFKNPKILERLKMMS
ncbi:MAG: site-specific tyrosine recombinase XerC [Methanocella sp. PtaU1.Bin125]|nr:MAG: site-specific tyrosine recombinase XerC [Methanocella sp. PtaU1.Bin125]